MHPSPGLYLQVLRVAQPLSQHAPVEDASAREAQLPCFYLLSKHSPDGATGSEFCQFLAETTTLKCSTGKCYETWIRNKLYASFYHSLLFPLWTVYFLILPAPFPSLSPSISTVLSSHTSPFTSLSYLLHKICSVCNNLEERSCIYRA